MVRMARKCRLTDDLRKAHKTEQKVEAQKSIAATEGPSFAATFGVLRGQMMSE